MLQRVSKTWQATIKGSLLMQSALYYVSTQLDMVTTGTGSTHAYLSPVADDVSAHHLTTAVFDKDSCVLNPFLKTLLHPRGLGSIGGGIVTHKRLQSLMSTAKSSWKTMQLTQPHATRVTLE